MAKISRYFDFIRLKGRPLAEINPGSNEFALKFNDALEAIELLKDSEQPILGGDILSDNLNTLGYAYQIWGSEYHCLNWYCEKVDKESQNAYCIRSYEIAKDSINKANEIAKKLGKSSYIVFVV
jgi:hypothetical protein